MDGLYGTTRPAIIDPATDIDIYYSYKRNRNDVSLNGETFKKLSDSLLRGAFCKDGDNEMQISGLYNLRLPLSVFNQKGLYTIYIKPKEYKVNIVDVSVLLSYPDVRGLVFNLKALNGITDLTGYRIEYLEADGSKTGDSRLITSCGYCEARETGNGTGVRYVYSTNASNNVFCTVTPSVSPSFIPNSKPYIGSGSSTEEVCLVNTKFDPVLMEIEMVDHDADTISNMLEGSQVRDLDNGKIITFNDNDDIYAYHEYFTLKDKLGNPLYDVKIKKDSYTENGDDYKELIKE